MSEQVITLTAEDQRKSNPKAAMVRAEVRSARGYANQRAHDLRIGPQPEYVDDNRSHLNRIILEPPTAPQMRQIVEERRAQRETSRALKSNAGIAVIGVIGFGIEAARLFAQLTPEQQDKAFLEAGQRIAKTANTTMVGAVIHLDETSTHAHLSFCGYDLDGVPLSSTMKRGMLTKFQDVLAEVMAEHCPGVERGNSKWKRIEAGASYAETVHKTVAEMHGTLIPEYNALIQKNEELAALIATKTARVAEMQGRVAKLENEEKQRELTATKVKRLRIYRARLADRVGDLREARDELTQLTAQIAVKQKLITSLEAQAEQAEQKAATTTERLQEAEQAADAADGRKTEVEAAVEVLAAQEAALKQKIQELSDAREQLAPDVTFLQGKKERLSNQAKEAERMAAEAQERAVQARQAADAEERRKTATEASVAALTAKKATLGADVSAMTETKAQLATEVSSLQNKKDATQAEIAQGEARVAELWKQAVRAQREADAAQTAERAAQATTEALRARNAALEADTRELDATKAQLQPEIASLTVQKETILTDGRKLLKASKELKIKVGELQETIHTLETQNNALEIELTDKRDLLDVLRPALQAAEALQQMSKLDLDEQHDAWAMMAHPDRDCSPIEHVSAIRMIDPLFAPDIPLPRSRVLDENLETLHACSQDLYDEILDAVMSEEGSEAGVEALRNRSVYLSQDGTVAGSGSEPDEPDLIGKAFQWAKTAFEGVKRGVGLALAATRDGIAEELTGARNGLFNAFEPRLQSALRRLLKAEAGIGVQNQKRETEPEHSPPSIFDL